MSHRVEPANLADTVEPYGTTPFLLYSGANGSARVNHVVAAVTADPATITITGFGRGVAQRVADGAQLSVLWPAPSSEQFSLIADGTGAMVDDETLTIAVSGAVLHRPAPLDGNRAC